MRIDSLNISGIGGIKKLDIILHDGFNVICGANGVGKTTVLNIIADAFSPFSQLKRNASFDKGEYTIKYHDVKGGEKSNHLVVQEFCPDKPEFGRRPSIESQYILLFPVNRILKYHTLGSIPRDKLREDRTSAEQLHSGVEISDLKGWFINRYVFSGKNKSLSREQEHNFELAKRAFSSLDPTVCFLTVDSGTLDIMLKTNRGDIYFEYLSDGYKTCFALILGLIKEIEYRFKAPMIEAEKFNGVVLIDEIDLHLHPTWQGPLIQTLKTLFPKVQFIVTTHSPSVLQTLSGQEILALCVGENGDTFQKALELGPYGLQGWTVEEILKDIMGMKTTTSPAYKSAIQRFDDAMEREDPKAVREAYAALREMLHPNNILLKMMDIQTAGLEEYQ